MLIISVAGLANKSQVEKRTLLTEYLLLRIEPRRVAHLSVCIEFG